MAGAGASFHGAAEAIWEQVAPELPSFSIEILPEVDSTNSELMRRGKTGQTEPVLLVALHQTAGRGRLGRSWHDEGASTLMFSLGMPLAPADWSGLSLAVGLSVAQSLHPDVRLKWPNDLWLSGPAGSPAPDRKLGGILVETATLPSGGARWVVIGVGVNVAPRGAQGLSTPPAWMQWLEPDAQAPGLLGRMAPPLVAAVRRFEQTGFAPLQNRFNQRDALQRRAIRLSDGTEGVGQGVDEFGALVVATASGVVKITSSEVSVRPA